jgi:transposase, IS5 family
LCDAVAEYSIFIRPDLLQRFWQVMADGGFITDAVAVMETSRWTGRRVLAEAGGVRPRRGRALRGRCLTFAEREEIALGRPAGESMRSIADRLGRSPATISRELERNLDRGRLAGVMPESASRLVSLHDIDARPIRKGRLGKPVEFGYKAQLVDNTYGVILDHNIEIGNPPDAPQLAPAIERITRRTGQTPRAVTADRGYGEASVERELHALGVRSVAIPRKGKPGAARREFEHRRAFRDKVKWRTGSEGRISHIKRSYGWNRTELTTIGGARTWCGHGVFAHNLVKIGTLAA